MKISVDEAIKQIDDGRADSSAFRYVRQYLVSTTGSDESLYNAVSVYLEEAPVVDWNIALKFVRYPDDPLVAAATIQAASLRRCPEREFWSAVEDIAAGEEWDSLGDARIQAILALNRNPYLDAKQVKAILLKNLQNSSAVMRDSAAISAQRCFGIPENEIIAGGELGKLFDRIPTQVIKWLEMD